MALSAHSYAMPEPAPVSASEKLQTLLAFCAETLGAHEAGSLRFAGRFRRQTQLQTDRQDRVRVMGQPAYYLEVIETGPSQSQARAGGSVVRRRHRFRVSLWYQYQDAETDQAASQARFDALVEGTDPARPGLLWGLRTVVFLQTEPASGGGGRRLRLWQPEHDHKDVVPLDLEGTELAHYLTFTIDISDTL